MDPLPLISSGSHTLRIIIKSRDHEILQLGLLPVSSLRRLVDLELPLGHSERVLLLHLLVLGDLDLESFLVELLLLDLMLLLLIGVFLESVPNVLSDLDVLLGELGLVVPLLLVLLHLLSLGVEDVHGQSLL